MNLRRDRPFAKLLRPADFRPFCVGLAMANQIQSRFPEDEPITPDIAEAIGHAIVEWGRTEDTAGCLTASLMNTDHFDFRAVTSNMMAHGKFDALAAVAKLKLSPRKAATIDKIVESIKGLSSRKEIG